MIENPQAQRLAQASRERVIMLENLPLVTAFRYMATLERLYCPLNPVIGSDDRPGVRRLRCRFDFHIQSSTVDSPARPFLDASEYGV